MKVSELQKEFAQLERYQGMPHDANIIVLLGGGLGDEWEIEEVECEPDERQVRLLCCQV